MVQSEPSPKDRLINKKKTKYFLFELFWDVWPIFGSLGSFGHMAHIGPCAYHTRKSNAERCKVTSYHGVRRHYLHVSMRCHAKFILPRLRNEDGTGAGLHLTRHRLLKESPLLRNEDGQASGIRLLFRNSVQPFYCVRIVCCVFYIPIRVRADLVNQYFQPLPFICFKSY